MTEYRAKAQGGPPSSVCGRSRRTVQAEGDDLPPATNHGLCSTLILRTRERGSSTMYGNGGLGPGIIGAGGVGVGLARTGFPVVGFALLGLALVLLGLALVRTAAVKRIS